MNKRHRPANEKEQFSQAIAPPFDKRIPSGRAWVARPGRAGEPGEVDLTQVGIMQARQRRGDHFSDAEIVAATKRATGRILQHVLDNLRGYVEEAVEKDLSKLAIGARQTWGEPEAELGTLTRSRAIDVMLRRYRIASRVLLEPVPGMTLIRPLACSMTAAMMRSCSS